MHSPDSCKGSFIDRVIVHMSHLSDSIDERLVYGHLRLEAGEGVTCNLRGLCCDHFRSTPQCIDFFDAAYKPIAEKLVKEYEEHGWKVKLSYINDGKNPVLKFSIKEKE